MKLLYLGMILLLGACSVDENKGEISPPTPTPDLSLPHSGVIRASQLTIHGQYVPKEDLASKYGRLPKFLESSTDADLVNITKTMHQLHTDSAGLYIAFETDASSITFNFTLRGGGVSSEANDDTENGFDLYSLDNEKWGSVQAFHGTASDNEVKSTYKNASGKMKKYILLFPLYNGVADKGFTLTIPKEAKIYDRDFFDEDKRKPILIYGTSITQGANPSRVGLAYTSRLLFDQKREIINMGFSSNAWMCKDMTDYVTSIPSAVFFIDPTMNMTGGTISRAKDNAKNMIRTYRKKHPRTPIVMVSQFDGRLTDSANGTEGPYGQAMKEVVDEIKKEVGNLHFLSRDNFIPEPSYRDNGNIDKVHPGDEGMKGYANKYNEILETIRFDESK